MRDSRSMPPRTRVSSWLFASVLILTVVAGTGPDRVLAQGRSDTAPDGRTTLTFDIPPQALSSALVTFSETTRLELLVDSRLTQGVQTPGVSGSRTLEDALRTMLVGTGLTYRFVEPRAVTLERDGPGVLVPAAVEAPLADGEKRTPDDNGQTARNSQKPVKVPEILVKDVQERDDTTTYVPDTASTATLTTTPIEETPQAVAVVTRKVLEDQKVIRLQEALKNVSGISNSQGGFGNSRDAFQCRGFECSTFKNGLNFDPSVQMQTFIESANVQRIEVLKGPPSVLYGRSEPGGVINIQTKQPLASRYYSLETIFGSFGLYRPTIDATGPLNENKTLLYRFNGAYENSDSFRDFVNSSRWFAAPVLTWKIGHNTTLTLEGEYLRDNRTIDRGIPAMGTRPAPIPLTRFLGEPFQRNRSEEGRAGYSLTHRFNPDWSLLSTFRMDLAKRDSFDLFVPGDPQPDGTLERAVFPNQEVLRSYNLRNDLIGHVPTGFLDHTFLFGVQASRAESDFRSAFESFPSINIFNPVYNVAKPNIPLTGQFDTKADSLGVYVQDQVSLLKDLKLLVGARFDYVRQTQVSDGVYSDQEDTAVSPRVGISYHMADPLYLYANYTQSFQPQVGLSAAGQQFDPSRGTQYEAGVKVNVVPNRLMATVAVYRIIRKNLLTTDPNNLFFSIQTGEQRSQGVELDLTASLYPGWQVIASYAYTDASVQQDTDIPVGNRLRDVARHAGSVWTTYEMHDGALKGLGGGVGLFAVGERNMDILNTAQLPGYVRTDAALFYRRPNAWQGRNLTVQLNILNLLDHQYFAFAQARNAAFPGAPLTFLGSIRLDF